MRTLFRGCIAAVVLAVLVSCSGAGAAARVAGIAIADERVATAASVFQAVSKLSQAPCGQLSGDGDTQDAACNRFTVGALISFDVAKGYADAHDVVVTDADLKDTADRFSTNFGDGALESELQAGGVTYDDFLTVLRASMLQQAVAAAIVESTVSDADLRAEYEASLADHVIVQIDHILVTTEAEADAVYAKVTADGATRADFLALAKKVSKDPSVAQNGGALGSTPVSQFSDPAFQQAVLAMDDGDISEPVQSTFGWHVIHMVDKEVTPFEDVRADLVASKSDAAFADYERGVIADGKIEVNPRFGRLDPQTLQIVRVTSTDPLGTASPTAVASVAPPG